MHRKNSKTYYKKTTKIQESLSLETIYIYVYYAIQLSGLIMHQNTFNYSTVFSSKDDASIV